MTLINFEIPKIMKVTVYCAIDFSHEDFFVSSTNGILSMNL